ncbi:Hypothetical predicted protein [Olea europaea subsp. europaea]|uniref:GDSL esterase/lipase n=1 Tax=Olea europaea subsp. europaea TaxID=158383 RepID=A0A8S0TXK9_OLEEU|nr:Hypothetical predicted protein [Olea europaea subsp. europaea]
MVPQIVGTIANAVRRVIRNFGDIRVVVPGNFPIGCLPIYLTGLNNFSKYHNEHLIQAIEELKIEHPNTTIIYGVGSIPSTIFWI